VEPDWVFIAIGGKPVQMIGNNGNCVFLSPIIVFAVLGSVFSKEINLRPFDENRFMMNYDGSININPYHPFHKIRNNGNVVENKVQNNHQNGPSCHHNCTPAISYQNTEYFIFPDEFDTLPPNDTPQYDSFLPTNDQNNHNPSPPQPTQMTPFFQEADQSALLKHHGVYLSDQTILNPVPYRVLFGHVTDIISLSWSQNNLLLSSSSDSQCFLWDCSPVSPSTNIFQNSPLNSTLLNSLPSIFNIFPFSPLAYITPVQTYEHNDVVSATKFIENDRFIITTSFDFFA